MAQRNRAYLITHENPQEHYEELKGFDYTKATPKELKAFCEKLNEFFVKGDKNHKDRDPEKNGCVTVLEVGEETKTFHGHTLACSSSPIAFSVMQKRFSHSNIDVLQGTIKAGLDYIYKRGKHEDKKNTQLCEPVSWGECFVDNRGASGNKVFDSIEELLDDGYSPQDIYAKSAKLAFYAGAIERTYNARKVSEIPIYQDVRVEYHVGKSGTGKTHTYIELCEQGLTDEIYLVSGDYKNPWDNYDFSQHRILFLDELRGHSLATSTLLGITDGYRMTLPARYTNKYKNWDSVYISTVIPPEELFGDSFIGMSKSDEDSFEQFKRRIDAVVYHYINGFLKDDSKYQTVSVTGAEYTGIRQLEEMATKAILEEGAKYGQQKLQL